MSFSDALDMYEEMMFDEDPVVKKKTVQPGLCEECLIGELVKVDGFPTCMDCGTMCLDAANYVSDAVWMAKRSMYKRRLYCIEKLKLMTGQKICCHPDYMKLVKRLKKRKVKSLVHLKQLLRNWNLRKFYKHIYNIYFDIKNIRLIKLTGQEIGKLSKQFVELEGRFKQCDTERNNMYNYSSILYLLMKRNKISCRKHIILPLNHLHISNKMKPIL